MRFGLFCSAQASRDDLPAETGQGFRDYLEYTQRTVSVSRSPAREGGSHVLAYADKRGATEEHALCGTPEEISSKLAALSDAGAEYVLLTVLGGKGQLRRFAQEVMPAFSCAGR